MSLRPQQDDKVNSYQHGRTLRRRPLFLFLLGSLCWSIVSAENSHQMTAVTMDMDDDSNNDNSNSFCRESGMPMTMFMDGFHSSLWSYWWNSSNTTTTTRPSLECLSFLVRTWMLSDAGKFVGAMGFSFWLAFGVEVLSAIRCQVHAQEGWIRRQKPTLHRTLMTIIYVVQGLLGYLIMLLTMAFSVEIILSVITGLMVGNMVCMRYDWKNTETTRPNRTGHRPQQHITSSQVPASGRLMQRQRRRQVGGRQGELEQPLLSSTEDLATSYQATSQTDQNNMNYVI